MNKETKRAISQLCMVAYEELRVIQTRLLLSKPPESFLGPASNLAQNAAEILRLVKEQAKP